MEHELDTLLIKPLVPVATRRLLLRPPAASDAARLTELANDRGVATMLAHLPHPYRIEHATAFLEIARDSVVFAVVERSSDQFIGICGLRPTERSYAADLGYWLGRPYWGRGYATEAAHAMIDLAFRAPQMECVLASCRAINGASRRVLEKCGFQHRGTGTFVSLAAGRVASEGFHLDRRAWQALKSWGRMDAIA